jgi:hypothetical protein
MCQLLCFECGKAGLIQYKQRFQIVYEKRSSEIRVTAYIENDTLIY